MTWISMNLLLADDAQPLAAPSEGLMFFLVLILELTIVAFESAGPIGKVCFTPPTHYAMCSPFGWRMRRTMSGTGVHWHAGRMTGSMPSK